MTKLLNFGLQIFNKFNPLPVIQLLYFQSNPLDSVFTFQVEKIDQSKFGKITFVSKPFNFQHQSGNYLLIMKLETS